MAVFVERTLTARKGKKRKTLLLRVHAPVDQGDHWRSKYEVLVDGERFMPATAGFAGMGGIDSWQALVLAMKTAAHDLVLFESRTGAKIDPMDWIDVIDHLAGMSIPDDMRPRLAEIERAIDKAIREYREQHAHEHHHGHGDHDHDHDHDHVDHNHDHASKTRTPSSGARRSAGTTRTATASARRSAKKPAGRRR